MARDVNPLTLTFRELHRWGWISQGHCATCRMSLKGNVAGMAALPTGDRPIALRFARGLYACCVCKTPLTGITIMGKVRRDGMRQLVEMGQCPDLSFSSGAASDDPFASRMWPATTDAGEPA